MKIMLERIEFKKIEKIELEGAKRKYNSSPSNLGLILGDGLTQPNLIFRQV